MTDLEQAARQALDLCLRIRDGREYWRPHELRAVCETLRAALSQQAEPVDKALTKAGPQVDKEQAEPVASRPKERDYVSHVGYTRALEAYCDSLEKQAEPAFEYRAAHAFNEGMSITISGHESPTGSFDGQYKVKSVDDEIGNPSY